MTESIKNSIKERILILDGAMGTMIQQYGLTEEDYRGSRFAAIPGQMKGNNDLLNLTRPELIRQIHDRYLEAGADIIETNTFNANSISMADYGLESLVQELNREAVRNARTAADAYTNRTPGKPRFVAGSVGPTNKTASISPDVSDPAFRNISFDALYLSYLEQIETLIAEGVDLLLLETCFDTLNLKSALLAAEEAMERVRRKVPVMVSFTIAGKSGRLLSGQTLGAALASISHVELFSVGLNCSFGAREMKPFLEELARMAPCYISAHPNAGLPNSLGQYDETPAKMAEQIKEYLDEGLVNIIGGCCGTTPEHIASYSSLIAGAKPHIPAPAPKELILSGLDPLEVKSDACRFTAIGERCNVAGSRRFLRLIKEKKYEEALGIARKQVEEGARILDINLDDGLLDGVREMTRFLNLMTSEPDIASVPLMLDSSSWEVLEAGLKQLQGKSIVNSISLKNGEEDFLQKARKIRSYGAAVVAMAFDEKGQADTFERKTEVCKRMYDLLTVKAGFKPEDIVFDPNVLAVATGIEEHNNYANDFIRTVGWIKENLPGSKVSGGVSNLSFAFRGHNYLREAMHAVFLYHCINQGMDMGIVNPSTALNYEEIPVALRELIEDLLLNRCPDAADRLIEYARNSSGESEKREEKREEWRSQPVTERLKYALIRGNGDFLEADIAEALALFENPVDIIDQPLMEGMGTVGNLFGEGKMFLPQVVKTARIMKKAVSILQPAIEEASRKQSRKAGRILIATVKGDVHDIGKNITGVILSCNNYEVIDIGVMVPANEIVAKAIEYRADMIGLSGLITPSLQEMAGVAQEMERAALSIPLMIGGATTSRLHTALKIDPLYRGPVVHVADASLAVPVANKLLNPETSAAYIREVETDYMHLREEGNAEPEVVSLDYARSHPFVPSHYTPVEPAQEGTGLFNLSLEEVIPYINWAAFLAAWRLPVRFSHPVEERDLSADELEKYNEAVRLLEDARALLEKWPEEEKDCLRAVTGFYPVTSISGGIKIGRKEIYFLRQQEKRKDDIYRSLADFFEPQDFVGLFAVTAGREPEAVACSCGCRQEKDPYLSMLKQILRDRLVEAAAEYLHLQVRKRYWGYAPEENLSPEELPKTTYQGIRPASGYPIHPDVSLNFVIDELLDLSKIGVGLTPNGALDPSSTIAGLYIAHPSASYFRIGKLGEDQLLDYASKRNLPVEEIRMWLGI